MLTLDVIIMERFEKNISSYARCGGINWHIVSSKKNQSCVINNLYPARGGRGGANSSRENKSKVGK